MENQEHNMSIKEEHHGEGSAYLPQLQAELDSIDVSFTSAKSLLEAEITRVKGGSSNSTTESKKFLEVHNMTPVKVAVFVLIPSKDHPKVNFVGKLLGPGGNTLKRLQQETQTRMAIQGRGSMKDKEKEEELRHSSDPKYAHLHDDLHLKIDAFAPAEEAYSRIANGLRVVQPFMIPGMHDEVGEQMPAPRGRGSSRGGGQGRGDGYYSREAPPSRGGGYDDYRGGRDSYGSASASDAYDRADTRGPSRYYDDSYSQPRSESARDRFGDYPPSRQSWSSQGNGYSSGGYSKAPRGRGGSERSHPYSRGGRGGY